MLKYVVCVRNEKNYNSHSIECDSYDHAKNIFLKGIKHNLAIAFYAYDFKNDYPLDGLYLAESNKHKEIEAIVCG